MRLLILTQKVNIQDPVLGFFHRWIVEFAKHCDSVIVICLEEGLHELPANVRVLSLGKERGGSKLGYMSKFYSYILRERNNYDAVFVHMNPIYMVLGGLIWRMSGKKVGQWYLHKHVDWKLRLAEKFAHFIFTASSLSCRLESPKKLIVGHGIDTESYAPDPLRMHNMVFTVVTIGRLSAIKNYDVLVDAIDKVRTDVPDVELHIVGGPVTPRDEAYEKELKAKVARLGLDSTVSFVGPLEPRDVPVYLNRADLFVNQSDTGSIDKAVLEAMSTGVPVLTSNEAFKEMLPADSFFTSGNSGELAEKIRAFARTRGGRGARGAALREKVVREFNLAQLIVRVLAVYNE